MKILFLTDNFPPEGNAPASRTFEHARLWVAAGHQVTVITTAPNFPEGVVYEGYRNAWRQIEIMEGIRVVRVGTIIAANKGFFWRTVDYISFALSGFLHGLREPSPDVVVATSPQFFCAWGGYWLSVFKRRPFVFELRDLWPESIRAVGAMGDGPVMSVLTWMEEYLYRRADVIVSVTESFKKELSGRGVPADKIHVVRNGVDLEQYKPQDKDRNMAEKFGLADKFVVGYVGTIGMAHALDNVLDAAARLRDQRDIVFMLVGSGAEQERLAGQAADRGLNNVVMVERQPKEVMPRIWSLCDVSLVHLRDSPAFAKVIPSKIFESMGMGLPMIIAQPEGEATEIVRDAGAGLVVLPEVPRGLAEAVLKLYENADLLAALKAASLAAAPAHSRDTQAQSMLDVMASVSN